MKKWQGKWAVVTGASSGIGTEFARLLAQKKCHLVLVARRTNLLRQIQLELEQQHQIQVHVLPCDLSRPTSAKHLLNRIHELKLPIAILINNAGVSIKGRFLESSLKDQLAMLHLHIQTLTELTYYFASEMQKAGEGWILQVSSLLGFSPCPNYAAYAASKAYMLNFSEALHYELKDNGVLISTLCPGVTHTERHDQSLHHPLVDAITMDATTVAKMGLKGLVAGKPHIIPGLVNQMSARSQRLLPQAWVLLTNDRLSR